MPIECVYGFPCVENPHMFSPDGESCTEKEIAAWEDAKRRWDAGERDVRGQRCSSVTDEKGHLVAHITASSWGIGVNQVLMAGECCESELEKAKSLNQVKSDGYAQEGDKWMCPECRIIFTHFCDEAEGCCWYPTDEGVPDGTD